MSQPRNEKDLYKMLDIPRGADKEEIRRAYKKMSLRFHPDKGGSEEDFKAISKAHDVLSDDQKRQIYDMTGNADEGVGQQNPFGGGGGGGMPFPFDIGSIFGNMFGGGGPMPGAGGAGGPGGSRVRRAKAPPKVHEIPLRLSDFYVGRTIQFKFERQKFCTGCTGLGCSTFQSCDHCGGRGFTEQIMMIGPGMQAMTRGPCMPCSGQGRKPGAPCNTCNGRKFSSQEKTLNVKIEPGMRVGQTFVFERECSDNPDYMEAGDVHIVLQEADENLEIRREGETLHTNLSLSLIDCLVGCQRKVMGHPAHTDGLFVDLPAGLMTGNIFVLEKAGMPTGSGFGNLFCHITVTITDTEKTKLQAHSATLRAMFTTA
jgi:DnaJ-class molecular chaperone